MYTILNTIHYISQRLQCRISWSQYLLVMSETSKDDCNRSNDEDEKGDYLPSQLAQIEATDLTFDIGENLTTKYVRLFYI